MAKATSKTKARGTKSKSTQTVARATLGAEELPRRKLEDSLVLARALHLNYAGKSASWEEVCTAAELSATTNNTKYLFWAAKAYGIINKEPSGQVYSLSETGRKIVAATYDGEDREGIVKAVLTPTLLSKFYTDYNGHPIPGPTHLPNVLETRFGVPRDRIPEATQIILDNAHFAGIVSGSDSGEQRIELSASSIPDPTEEPADVDGVGVEPSALPEGSSVEIDDWKKVCFVITPLGSEGSEERRHADMMLKHLLAPVAEQQFKLKLVRANKIAKAGLITQQIFEHLAKARVCVADLSFSNPNVFYELGVRHVCKLPTIQIVRKGDKIPFDVSQGRTIVIDSSDVYTVMDRFESARRELAEHMKHILSTDKGDTADDNPVNVYLPSLRVTLPT
jgi:hypothetical protein